MKSQKITVVIPMFNEKDMILPCLEALHNQTRPADEIIVVDNNSTDGCTEIVKNIQNVRLLTERRQGLVFVRETGFNAASGDIIVKIDADSRPDAEWLHVLEADMEACDAWSGPVYYYDGKPSWLRGIAAWVFNTSTFFVNRLIIGGPMLFGSNLAIRRNAWNEIKSQALMQTNIWEDLDLALLLKAHGNRLRTSNRRLVGISTRSLWSHPITMYRRLFGSTRVYWHHNKLKGVVSFFVVHAYSVWFLVKLPHSLVIKSTVRRPSDTQY